MSILVRHAMTENPHTIDSDMNAADAAAIMKTENVGSLPVVAGGELVGVLPIATWSCGCWRSGRTRWRCG